MPAIETILIVSPVDCNFFPPFFQTVRSLLYNVLLFPAGGWLVDSTSNHPDQTELMSQEDDQDKLREKELEYLRAQCIPEVTLRQSNRLKNISFC